MLNIMNPKSNGYAVVINVIIIINNWISYEYFLDVLFLNHTNGSLSLTGAFIYLVYQGKQLCVLVKINQLCTFT